jgi:hypothetical protein
MRVSKAGYIETPSRLREIFYHKRWRSLRQLFGRPAPVGFGHHRWFVEIEESQVTFTPKTITAVASRDFFITRSELGRQLSEMETAATLFWAGQFSVTERLLIAPGETETDLRGFKQSILARLGGQEAEGGRPAIAGA